MIPAQHRKKAAWAVVAVGCVSGFEGLRTAAYRDPVGIPTVCFGETRGVKMGDRYTPEQCGDMLADRLMQFNIGVDTCVFVPMSDQRRAAAVSFAYNVGVGAFCKSGFVRKLNAGDPNACDELTKWVYATKAGVRISLPGLVRRRNEERALCKA